MKINGYDVKQSEFEYFFKKNNTDSVLTANTVKQYADLYLNFKLKVQAAIDEGMDKSESFLNEYSLYRNMQAEDYLVDNVFLDMIAHDAYEQSYNEVGPDGLVYLLAISSVPEDDTQESLEACMKKMSVVYDKLQRGEDFRELAKEYSDDKIASNGGELGWVMRDQLPSRVADIVFDMPPGGYCEPIVSDGMVFIVKVENRRQIGTFESESADIYEWIHRNTNYYTEAKIRKANEYAERMGWDVRDLEAVTWADSLLEEIEPEFGNISREYHDGLLFFDISSKEVWEKAANDADGMQAWFKSNKKLLKYEEPCFKGLVFFCVDEDIFHQVEKALEGVDFSQWVDTITTFNRESVKVRVMRGSSGNGVFIKGQNAYVDKIVFGIGEYEPMKNFPYVNVVGKLISEPESVNDLGKKATELYQNYLEKQWIKKLRKQYKYKIYNKALKKVSLNK
jgi:Parvulin-like peptidyl-prolyl isomerase